MTVKDLLPVLRTLPRAEKLQLIQFLADELEKEENKKLPQAEEPSYTWSPSDAFGAGNTLFEVPPGGK
ncbi:MAG: hypothetical protein KDJ65_26150 [Anaerolineae bacterium]|nr:hypothetical protein [Anaerolineae bacterium]